MAWFDALEPLPPGLTGRMAEAVGVISPAVTGLTPPGPHLPAKTGAGSELAR